MPLGSQGPALIYLAPDGVKQIVSEPCKPEHLHDDKKRSCKHRLDRVFNKNRHCPLNGVPDKLGRKASEERDC